MVFHHFHCLCSLATCPGWCFQLLAGWMVLVGQFSGLCSYWYTRRQYVLAFRRLCKGYASACRWWPMVMYFLNGKPMGISSDRIFQLVSYVFAWFIHIAISQVGHSVTAAAALLPCLGTGVKIMFW